MIAYNPKEWFSLIVRFNKADTVRQLTPMLMGISIYTFLLVALDRWIFKIGPDSVASKISVMYSLLGFVISLLLVFRTNTAYERWWEGRKLWGALMNCSRNLSIKLRPILSDHPNELQELKKLIIHFPYALKNHLRNASSMNETELQEIFHISELRDKKHLPLHISDALYRKLIQLNKEGKITGEQLLILNIEAQQWMEICGGCERIRNTPIPFSYSVFLKKFIFVYAMTLPVTYAPVLGFYSILIVAFIVYVLASLELIAEEIENPFGTDANDLPLDEIAKGIRQSVELVIS